MKRLIYSQEDLDLIISLDIQEKDEKIETLQQELQRKDNNWNELKKYLEIYNKNEVIKLVLNKIKGLENDN